KFGRPAPRRGGPADFARIPHEPAGRPGACARVLFCDMNWRFKEEGMRPLVLSLGLLGLLAGCHVTVEERRNPPPRRETVIVEERGSTAMASTTGARGSGSGADGGRLGRAPSPMSAVSVGAATPGRAPAPPSKPGRERPGRRARS